MKGLSMFQITLLAIFGACAVIGVIIFALVSSSTKSKSVGSVVIWGTINAGVFTEMTQNAANSYPALSQVTYAQKDPKTYTASLTQALAAGSGPDLFLISQDQAVEDSGEAVVFPYTNLSKTQFQNAFIEAADPFLAPSGVVALPIAADPLVLYWNKDMLATAGYSEPPTYWDQVPAMARKLTVKDDAGNILQSTIALGEYQNINDAKDILSALVLQAGGTLTSYDSGGRLDSTVSLAGIDSAEPAVVTALRFYTQFSDPANNDYSWNRSLPEAQQDFAQGKLALYIGFASEQSVITGENPNLNFSVTALPQIRGAAHTVNFARVYGFAVSRTSKNIAGAQTVAATLVTEVNAAAFATAFDIASPRRDVLALPASGNQALFNASTITSYSWVDPNPDKTATIFQAMIENTTSGTALIGDAVGRADAEMTQTIAGLQQH